MTRAHAKEWIEAGITVNAVCPGFVDTDITETAVANIVAKTGCTAAEARGFLVAGNPRGVLVTPEEVAAAIMTFLGPASGSLAGQALGVAGGEIEG